MADGVSETETGESCRAPLAAAAPHHGLLTPSGTKAAARAAAERSDGPPLVTVPAPMAKCLRGDVVSAALYVGCWLGSCLMAAGGGGAAEPLSCRRALGRRASTDVSAAAARACMLCSCCSSCARSSSA